MKKLLKSARLYVMGLAVLVLSLALFLPAPPAKAVTNPYTPGEVCGSGYSVVRKHELIGADLYLMYNRDNGYNCVTAIKVMDVGLRTFYVNAGLRVGNTWRHDPVNPGNDQSIRYKYYAGPVKAYARDQCVKYSGWAIDSWTSPWTACG